jgi:hypothetical protein
MPHMLRVFVVRMRMLSQHIETNKNFEKVFHIRNCPVRRNFFTTITNSEDYWT